jgi:predicted translin family RNA/ssDNA-binding protein
MSTENFETSIVITDDNREEIERLYGKIPSESELLEAPETHSLEEARQSMHPLEKLLDKLNDETEEAPPDETYQQNT